MFKISPTDDGNISFEKHVICLEPDYCDMFFFFSFNILLPVPDMCEKDISKNVGKMKKYERKAREENCSIEINIHRGERTKGSSLSQRILVKSD